MDNKETWTIFLDIDGVLVTAESGFSSSGANFSAASIFWLNKLFAEYDFQIVVSSTWREIYSLSELRELLEELNAPVVSTTPLLEMRGQEIQDWLKANNGSDKFIIVDDEIRDITPFFDEKHIIYVEDGFSKKGFFKEHFSKAVEIVEAQNV